MKNRILTTSILLFLSFIMFKNITAQVSTIKFNIRAIGSNVGEIEVKKTVTNGVQNIEIKSVAKANMLVKKVNYVSTVKSTYKEGVMLYGSGKNEENGEVEIYTTAKKNGNSYEVNVNGDAQSLSGDIKYSVSTLYFSEPKGVSKIYSEVWGKYLDLKDNGDGSYTLVLPKGGNTVFYYTDGNMTYFTNDSKVGKIKMTRLD